MKARDAQCYLLLLARTFQQFMRNILAALLVVMPDEVREQKGAILSAVAAGYLLTQVPGGVLADKIGAKNVVTMAMLGSALSCLAIPYAYDLYGGAGVWWCLAFMGAIQGPLFPTSSVFLKKWIPADERGRASTYVDIGISVGALVSIPAGNYCGTVFGWQQTYAGVGAAALAFVALWVSAAAESPEACSYISAEEKTYLAGTVGAASPTNAKAASSPTAEVEPLWKCVMKPAVLSIFACHMAFNYGAYFLTNWNPTYYKEVLAVESVTASAHLSAPHVSNLVGKLLNTPIASLLSERGVSRLGSRKVFTVLCLVGAGSAMLPVYWAKDMDVLYTTALMTTANVFWGMSPSGFKANYLDVTVEYTGVISGIGNTLGTVASYLGPQVVSHVLATTGSWNLIFVSIFCINCVCAVLFSLFATGTPVEHKKKRAD